MVSTRSKKVLALALFVFFSFICGIILFKENFEKKRQPETNIEEKIDSQETIQSPDDRNDMSYKDPDFEIADVPDVIVFEKVCNIKDYGAKSGGKIINSTPIFDAISDCARSGGGRVLIPPGKWKTGAIHLRNNIDLHLEKGAQIIFSSDPNDYLPVVFTRFEGMELYNYSPLIYANNCENVSISGEGILDGQGKEWSNWNNKQDEAVFRLYTMINREEPVESRVFGTKKDSLRPSFVQFINCKNVSVSGITALDGPMWTFHFIYSESIKIKNINVRTISHNTDGIVIDSSKNAIIEDSNFETGDDAIAIKSGLDRDGWRVNRPSENIFIKNILVKRGHSGISIGSEMSGGVRNVLVSDCQFKDTWSGIRLKSMRGRGGTIENVWFKNIEMDDIETAALLIDATYSASTIPPKTDAYPKIKNLYFENIKCLLARDAIEIDGDSEHDIVEKIIFKDIDIKSRNGAIIKNGKNILLENVNINFKDDPAFHLENSKNIIIDNPGCEKKKAKICLSIKGKESEKIILKGDNLSFISSKISFDRETDPGILTVESN